MRPDIVRQPLLLAVLSLLAVIAAALVWGAPLTFTEGAPGVPLGDLLRGFQDNFPVWSKVISGALIFASGVVTGRLTIRYGLYPVSTSLAVPLYGLVACGILIGQNYLAEFTAAFVLLLSTRNYFACYRNGYAVGPVFRASFYLGILPLLYAPALALPVLFLPAAFCFRRTLREAFVALCGVLLPTLTACYVAWGQGADFVSVPIRLWDSFSNDSGYHLFENTTLLSPALVGIILFIVLCAVFFSLAGFRTQSLRGKAILLYTMILFIATAALAAAPSATPGVLGLIALPGAILMPQTFIRIHNAAATLLYAVLYGICIANIILH